MKSSYKIISGISLLMGSFILYSMNPTYYPDIFVCIAVIFVITGIFESKKYSNKYIYWGLISMVLISNLIWGYILSPPLLGNELLYYLIIGLFVIMIIWYSSKSIKYMKTS